MNRVLLLVARDRNRELLGEWLDERHEVVTAEGGSLPDEAIDLCVIDDVAFARYADRLEARKQEAAPVFLPYLLMTSDTSVAVHDPAVWDAVDEIVTPPSRKAELRARIEGLLERRRLSAELHRRKTATETRFQTLFNLAPDMVVVVDEAGVVRSANDAFCEWTGITRERLLGRAAADLPVAGEDGTALDRMFAEAGDDPVAVEGPDGDPRYLDVRSAPVDWDAPRDRTETVESTIYGLRDVTARTRQRQALERQNERLQEFAATVAHDLRNPLGIAQGHLELAAETGDAEHFDVAERALDRMEALVDEVLTLARQGQTVLDPKPVDLRTVAETAWSHVETDNATLTVVDGLRFKADEGRLLELCENLFRNAVEHAGDAPAIEVCSLDGGDGFYVADDGPGIPDGDEEMVFETGYTTTNNGSGFGLAIVRQIVEAHDWSVSAGESEAGGARFEIRGVEPAEGWTVRR